MLRDIGLATIVINLIALLVSLYTLQVYDRVIPRGGFETLFVLTLGMGVALLIDFCLKVSRALILDRESGDIDVELSKNVLLCVELWFPNICWTRCKMH